jgi:hypothetical protein
MQESRQLTRIVDELLAAHDDTIRLAGELALSNWQWEEHLDYLSDLKTLGRAALSAANDCGVTARRSRSRRNPRRRGARRCARYGHDEGSA